MSVLEAARRQRLVFVDPEDEAVSYWWPALVVTEDEYELFRETMESDIKHVADSERLVCYFEDASFSVVPTSALVPFCPGTEPYVTYARGIPRFAGDPGVSRATKYWRNGEVPDAFKWLLAERGRERASSQPKDARAMARQNKGLNNRLAKGQSKTQNVENPTAAEGDLRTAGQPKRPKRAREAEDPTGGLKDSPHLPLEDPAAAVAVSHSSLQLIALKHLLPSFAVIL